MSTMTIFIQIAALAANALTGLAQRTLNCFVSSMEKLAHREVRYNRLKQIAQNSASHPEAKQPLWALLRSDTSARNGTSGE